MILGKKSLIGKGYADERRFLVRRSVKMMELKALGEKHGKK